VNRKNLEKKKIWRKYLLPSLTCVILFFALEDGESERLFVKRERGAVRAAHVERDVFGSVSRRHGVFGLVHLRRTSCVNE